MPRPLFQSPYSAVLEDRDGNLLGARIATDGQWRFPISDKLPEKYAKCVVNFEDKRFYFHPGFDPIGMARALVQNIRQKKVISGGSTLTMQVIRMAKNNPPRTIWQKVQEVFCATRLELTYSKKKILQLYATNAPFGGNVVGLEAASWRYFGKKPELLSWSESATLAVLPNSPALIHPGRNRALLEAKRNRLLQTLHEKGLISTLDFELACEEPLPEAPQALPQLAPHLLDRLSAGNNARFHSTINRGLQERVTEILTRRQQLYRGNEVNNIAAVVIDVKTGDVLAYVGNAPGAGADHGEQVDILKAPRSTGSILKPYLYALALESGDILPNSLLSDVPIQMGNYRPENYYESFDGAVRAKRALIRSLNIPFVLLLEKYGLEKFHHNLQRLGLSTINQTPDHYGLTLILGGAEANLLDITNTYACMSRRLGLFYDRNGRYATDDFRPPNFLLETRHKPSKTSIQQTDLLSAGSIWFAFEAMQEVERPSSAGEWELFRSNQHIAWKTGTSFGFRDAWAAGVTPQYAVGVWVGNADGEGRPGLLGVEMAAPVLFEIFSQLPNSPWFDPPYDAMAQIAVCQQTGFKAGPNCPTDTVWAPQSGILAPACPYHQLLHLDPSRQWQVHANCEAPENIVHQPWFVLPPLEEYFFKSKNPSYQPPPPFRADCLNDLGDQAQNPMQLIYPKKSTKIYVPVDLNGVLSSTVFRVAHRKKEVEIYWHLDGAYLGSTKTFHEMALQPTIGKHHLSLVDADGFRLEQNFEIVSKN